jgi:hypothetical protein
MTALELIFCIALVYAAGVATGWRRNRLAARPPSDQLHCSGAAHEQAACRRTRHTGGPSISAGRRALIEHLRFDLGAHLCNLRR